MTLNFKLKNMIFILAFVVQVIAVAASNSTSKCNDYSACSTCLGTTSQNCVWCSQTSACISNTNADSYCSASEQMTTCDETYYTIIFICVLSALMCICCGACYMKKYRSYNFEGLSSPLLPHVQRGQLLRESLSKEGKQPEWMCIICGFDNHPRNKHCNMCGTEQQFSKDYKEEKKARKTEIKLRLQREHQKRLKEITIPDDAQVNTQNILAFTFRKSTDSNSFGSKLKIGLTPEKRREALNYRRLNQLSLRQKSARRRKTWQRVVDDNSGELKWIRVAASDVYINNAPLGYTPRTSLNSEGSNNSILSISGGNITGDSQQALLSASLPSSQPGQLVMSQNRLRGNSEKSDSFGDILSSSPGFTSVFDIEGNLNWEKVDEGGADSPGVNVGYRNPTQRRNEIGKIIANGPKHSKRASADENPANIPRSSIADLNDPYASFDTHDQGVTNALHVAVDIRDQQECEKAFLYDLETVASLAFKDKLLWFLDRIDELQRPWTDGFVRLEIRRSHILQDSVATFGTVDASELHKWMRIQFINEPGVDAGGLEREWFELVTSLILAPETGLFICSSSDGLSGSYHINPTSGLVNPKHLEYFRFVGRIFGKAIMEQQSSSATLSLPLRKQILTMPITFSDLEFVDIELFRNLSWLQKNDNVEAICLDFTVCYEGCGQRVTYDLKPDGVNIAVNDANKEEYLQLRLKHRMLDSIKTQLQHLLIGLFEVIPPDILSVFDYHELELLMCGVPDINVADWMNHTEYIGEYKKLGGRHKVIKWFWKSVESMANEERVRLLQFVTGCSRLPSQGFKLLQSSDGNYRKFNIQSIPKKESAYPRAHTCFNKLDLPVYDSEQELDAYLSIVISLEVTGFSME